MELSELVRVTKPKMHFFNAELMLLAEATQVSFVTVNISVKLIRLSELFFNSDILQR